jgi:DnaJ-class molecular chaperone
MHRDYYAVLGIAATAGSREIRQAYRRLARQYSPDVNLWDEEARSLFTEIAEAYRVLSEPAAREMYDRFGHQVVAGALDPSRRGDDVHAAVDLSFAQAARGVRLTLDVQRFSPCDDCGARGQDGRGVPCARCAGRGVHRRVDPLAVTIPAGVESGSQVCLAGEGSAAPFGGPRGDLIVSTRVREHPFFKRKGDTVHCEIAISVWEAIRGARVRVPTPGGEAFLVVPPGTTAGQTFRLRGQGLPRLTTDGTGDLFVTIQVVMPRGLDERTDELVRQLERLMPLSPRESLERYAAGAG